MGYFNRIIHRHLNRTTVQFRSLFRIQVKASQWKLANNLAYFHTVQKGGQAGIRSI